MYSHRFSHIAFSLVMSTVFFACGAKDDESQEGKLTEEAKVNARYQTAASLQDIGEAVSSLDGAGASFALEGSNSESGRAPTRTCEAIEGGGVKVTELREWSEEKTNEGGRWTRTWNVSTDTSRTLTWTPPTGGAALSCNSGNQVRVGWLEASSVNGLGLQIELQGSRSATISVVGSLRDGKSVSLELGWNRTATGSRSVLHSDYASDETSLSFVRTIESSIVRNDSGKRRKEGSPTETEEYNIEHTVATKEGAPLKVKTEVSKESRSWTRKTILQGTLVSTQQDTNRVESTFESVVFENGTCLPVSGSVNVSIFPIGAAADASPAETYVIQFASTTESGVSIQEDDDEPVDFPEGLEFLANCEFGAS